MPSYETLIVTRSDVAQQTLDAFIDTIVDDIVASGGSLKKREYWGVRTLAYRIKKSRKGHYYFLGLDVDPPCLVEVGRKLRLNEGVLRHLTIRVNQIDDGPSIMLMKRGDDKDRLFRGPRAQGRLEGNRRRPYEDREEFRARDDVPVDDDRNVEGE